MSGTSMTDEMADLVDAFGYTLADLRWFTINAMKSAFLPFDERLALIDEMIKPGYAALAGLTPASGLSAARRCTRACSSRPAGTSPPGTSPGSR